MKALERPGRRRASPPKLVTLNNALCAVVDPRGIPDARRDPQRFGSWVENACLAFAWNSGQRVLPAHRTPNLNADKWLYYDTMGLVDRVVFVDGKIKSIVRGEAP